MMMETLEVRSACILLADCSREVFLLAEAQGLSTEELRIPEKRLGARRRCVYVRLPPSRSPNLSSSVRFSGSR